MNGGSTARSDGGASGWADGLAGRLRTVPLALWWLAAAVGVVVGLRRATDSLPRLVPGDVAFALAPERLLGASHDGRLRAVAVGAAPVVAWVVTGLAGYRGLAAVVDAGATPPVGGPLTAVVGVVPGCGVHVGFVTGDTEGAVRASALVANAISQGGDAVLRCSPSTGEPRSPPSTPRSRQ